MKVENVVKPPQKPVVRNIRRSPFIKLPRSNKPYKSPIIKQPNTFTTMVPHGKPDAMLVWTACESKYRGSRNLMGISVELCDSKEEKLFICHSMKISSEKFDFSIE